jgi:hypothetical protein
LRNHLLKRFFLSEREHCRQTIIAKLLPWLFDLGQTVLQQKRDDSAILADKTIFGTWKHIISYIKRKSFLECFFKLQNRVDW